MRRSHRILATYTGDVSGACSALFELGGMVVIHDPSGCNSTYNTHDETRWYDHDSLIFISALRERDAILGNDDKLVRDVVDAARELHPRFVALCNSPIPFITGTDFKALCRKIERDTGIPCFYVATNGMHDYVAGSGNAFVALAERFVKPRPAREGTLNLLGVTPLDLGVAGSDKTLRAWAEAAGFEVTSCWAMGSSLDELARAAEAQVNLVVSATGLAVARYLRKQFGTPYVVGMPLGVDLHQDGRASIGGTWSAQLAAALEESARTGTCAWPCRTRGDGSTRSVGSYCFMGEPVMMGSLAAALADECPGVLRVICPLEVSTELLAATDVLAEGEEGVEEALANELAAQASDGPAQAISVVADAFYEPILPEGSHLVRVPTPAGPAPLAHQALSGRNGWKSAIDPVTLDPRCLLEQ